MNKMEFQRKACEFVAKVSNSINDQKIKPEEIIILWSKGLENESMSCMVSTKINSDIYYEVIYDKDKKKLDLILVSREIIKSMNLE